MVADPTQRQRLLTFYHNEERTAFVAARLAEAFGSYVSVTLERFENPFLDHRIADIAQNHAQKVERRIKAILEYAVSQGDQTPKPTLAKIVARHLAGLA